MTSPYGCGPSSFYSSTGAISGSWSCLLRKSLLEYGSAQDFAEVDFPIWCGTSQWTGGNLALEALEVPSARTKLPVCLATSLGINQELCMSRLRFMHLLQGPHLREALTSHWHLWGFGQRDIASALPWRRPGRCSIEKSYADIISIHLAILFLGSFKLNNHFRA
jgi:hypothetical protein